MDGRVKPGHDENWTNAATRFPFAPSPNGYLHLGHAYSALLNFDLARQCGGRFLLRIEDIDATRCRPEFEAGDLRRPRLARHILGNAGAAAVGAPRATIARRWRSWRAQGLIYPSFESRAEIARLVAQREARAPWPRDPDGAPLYPGAREVAGTDERERLIAIRAALCAAARHGGGAWRAAALTWIEQGEGPAARPASWPPAGGLGRRHPRAQGDADQLSPVGRDRRRPAGRHRRGAGAGPVLVDQRAPAAAASARSAAAGLPAPPPGPRRRRAEAVEIDQGHRYSRTAGGAGATPPISAVWSVA